MKTHPAGIDPSHYPETYDLRHWLPTTVKEARLRGWEEADVILFTGDAYVDHPAFGAAVIGRTLEAIGLKVALVPQPNWRDDLRDFQKFGKPRLFFGVTAGNMDSMVNHYTARKRLRSTDAYTPGNVAGFRPDRATTVYAGILKKLYPDSIVVAGGIEASLRRYTHYDYWNDTLMPGLLHDSSIDMLAFGMAEKTMQKLALNLLQGKSVADLYELPQIAFRAELKDPRHQQILASAVILNSHEQCLKSKKLFAQNFVRIEQASNMMNPPVISQKTGDQTVIVNPPEPLPQPGEIDRYYEYPYTRLPHPKYWKKPLIPAFEMIRFSVNIHRGCFGGCAFCTISTHQGKFIQSRSANSVLNEVKKVIQMPGFHGNLSDLGGPSANMYQMQGIDTEQCRRCKRPSCIYPSVCHNLNTSHQPLLDVYRQVKKLKGIRKVFIGSGIRYDLLTGKLKTDQGGYREYAEELIREHVSGRLKVAPEHTHSHVLKIMRKPDFQHFRDFNQFFNEVNKRYHLKQQLIPYFISAHPGCSAEDMAELAVETKDLNFRLQQVQDFTPTPMTLATVMFYTGLDPYTMKPIQIVTDPAAKKSMSDFFFWYKKEVRQDLTKSLKKINRIDLIRKLTR